MFREYHSKGDNEEEDPSCDADNSFTNTEKSHHIVAEKSKEEEDAEGDKKLTNDD